MDRDLLICFLILVVTGADALRDAWMSGTTRTGWWQRHIVKWVQFYAPLVAILYLGEVPWELCLGLIPVAWVTWRWTLRHIGGVHWESWLSRIGL